MTLCCALCVVFGVWALWGLHKHKKITFRNQQGCSILFCFVFETEHCMSNGMRMRIHIYVYAYVHFNSCSLFSVYGPAPPPLYLYTCA